MAGNIYAWSQTAASNASADSTINWAEGQLPGTLNDSARAEMAVQAAFLADNNATTTTAGTGAAYTVTSALTEASLATGIKLRLKMNATNTGACTLTLTPAGGSAFAAKSIRVYSGAGGTEADPVAGTIQNNGIYEFNYDAAANSAAGAWMLMGGTPSLRRLDPGGRLTLTTATPVLIANTTAQGTVYYTPYIHDVLPLWDGASWAHRAFTELSCVLDSTNILSGSNYDFFVADNAGTLALGYTGAWTNNTTRSNTIARQNGIWTNSGTVTLRLSSSTTISVAANKALYVGTIHATANGQTGMNFDATATGGGANILGVYNAYNRVKMTGTSRDNTASWTYASLTWRATNNNTNNSVSFMDGLGTAFIRASNGVPCNAGSGNEGAIGINLNSSSATPAQTATTFASQVQMLTNVAALLPALGYNTVNSMEASNLNGNNNTFYGTGQTGQSQWLVVEVDL